MSILRRVGEVLGRVDAPPDDCWAYRRAVFDALTPEELAEWKRQYDILEGLVPLCGSHEAAMDEFDRRYPSAM